MRASRQADSIKKRITVANIKQAAGHDALGEFAHLNDDVLFGEVWNREGLSPKLRSIVTVSALIGKDITDSSPKHHLAFARANGVTQTVEEDEAEEARTKQCRDRMELIGEEQPCC